MKQRSVEIIVLKESLWQSVLSDAVTFVTVLSLVGIGVYVGSTALQWTGAAMFFLTAFAKVVGHKRLSIAEARTKLDEIERAVQP